MENCPGENTLSDFVDGRLAQGLLGRVEAHLARCDLCRLAASSAVPSGAARRPGVEAAEGAPRLESPPDDGARPGRGEVFGRYFILAPLGAGGMGVVYAAYDPELDRKIAIKLLRKGETADAEEQQRLLREAKAMARVVHPAVVSVFDAGTSGGRVFIAMELVEGETLRAWSASAKRPWRAVTALFVECGRGLLAAHQVGLVHRDFKPDNVLVTRDGRAKVTDFGLARASVGASRAPPHEPAAGQPPGPVDAALTRTGTMLGTPSYMAPEQLRGQRADARADQWSFCVALYEALSGRRPFEGATFDELRAAVLEGKLPGELTAAPRSIARVLRRGLSPSPADRYPSMLALVEDLDRARRPVSVRALAAAAAGALAITALALSRGLSRPGPDPCLQAAGRARAAWDAGARDQARRAFEATARPFAADAFREADAVLGRYAGAAASTRVDICQATRTRNEQSERLFDLRVRCVDERVDEAAALGRLFGGADGRVVENAVQAAYALAPLAACDDAAALLARVPLPRDPAARARLDALSAELSAARAEGDAARYESGLLAARRVREQALPLAYRPLEARACLLEGELLDRLARYKEAEDALGQAFLAAEAADDDETAFAALVTRVAVTGYRLAQPDEARRWDGVAGALAERRPRSERQGHLEAARAIVAHAEGRYESAITHGEQARAAATKGGGGDRPEFAFVLVALGRDLLEVGRVEEAVDRLGEAISLRERLLGPSHPLVAQARSQLGFVFLKMGRYEQSLAELGQARAIQEASLGPDHLETAYTLNRIGDVYLEQGAGEEALRAFERVLLLGERILGPAHPEVGLAHMNLAIALRMVGRLSDAERECETATRVLEQAAGPAFPYLGTVRYELGNVRVAQRRFGEAEALHRSALAFSEKAYGPDYPELAEVLTRLAEDALERHDPREARALLTRALRLRPAERSPRYDLAELRLDLARALSDAKEEPALARALAEQAREALGDKTPRARRDLALVDAWLAAHPAR